MNKMLFLAVLQFAILTICLGQEETITLNWNGASNKFFTKSDFCIGIYDIKDMRPIYIPAKITLKELESLFGKATKRFPFSGVKGENTHAWVYKDISLFIALRNDQNLLMVRSNNQDRITIDGYQKLPWTQEYLYNNFSKELINIKLSNFRTWIYYNIGKGVGFDLGYPHLEEKDKIIIGFQIYGNDFIDRKYAR